MCLVKSPVAVPMQIFILRDGGGEGWASPHFVQQAWEVAPVRSPEGEMLWHADHGWGALLLLGCRQTGAPLVPLPGQWELAQEATPAQTGYTDGSSGVTGQGGGGKRAEG